MHVGVMHLFSSAFQEPWSGVPMPIILMLLYMHTCMITSVALLLCTSCTDPYTI